MVGFLVFVSLLVGAIVGLLRFVGSRRLAKKVFSVGAVIFVLVLAGAVFMPSVVKSLEQTAKEKINDFTSEIFPDFEIFPEEETPVVEPVYAPEDNNSIEGFDN